MGSKLLVIVLMTLFSLPHTLFSHEQKTALTDVFFNTRTGNIEIAHRISLHDAEHVIQKITGNHDDLTKSQHARKAFAKYVSSHFTVTRQDNSPITLNPVGHEIEGGHLWIYQETKIPNQSGKKMIIENTILLNEVEGQINTVNIRSGPGVFTLTFRSGSSRKAFPIPPGND